MNRNSLHTHGSYYNADKLKTLIDDPMRIPVILTAYYGLRRSEVPGIKWDAIDYTVKKLSSATRSSKSPPECQ